MGLGSIISGGLDKAMGAIGGGSGGFDLGSVTGALGNLGGDGGGFDLGNILGGLGGSSFGGSSGLSGLFDFDKLATGAGSGGSSGIGKLLGKSGIGDSLTGALGISAGSPPSDAQRLSETQYIKELTSNRTPEQDARAMELNNRGGWGIWQDEAKKYREENPGMKGILGTAAMDAAIGAAAGSAYLSKNKYDAKRPFELDSSISVLGNKPSDSSFPSGHTAASTAAAAVLSKLWPERAGYYQNLAKEVQWARMYSGVHLPSDIAAGQQIGMQSAELVS